MKNFIEQILKEDYGFSEVEIAGYLKCRDKLQEDSLQLNTNSLSVRNTCEWAYSFSGTGKIVIKDFHTECKHAFHYLVPIVGKEEIYKFCPYCGKRIVEKGIKE